MLRDSYFAPREGMGTSALAHINLVNTLKRVQLAAISEMQM